LYGQGFIVIDMPSQHSTSVLTGTSDVDCQTQTISCSCRIGTAADSAIQKYSSQ